MLDVVSPAIDAGDDGAISESNDLAGAQRIQGDAVNLGPYEVAADPEKTIYVDQAATGAHDGSSWENALTSLQDALARVNGNDEIRVAEGTYYPDEGRHVSDGDEEASFRITDAQDGLEVYGGYPAGGGERDPTAHPVVLSGDIHQNDASFAREVDSDDDPSTPTQTDHLIGHNSTTVVFLNGVKSTTLLDGLTITGGQADVYGSQAGPSNAGGGMYCLASTNQICKPTLRNVIFQANTAQLGGALFNDGRVNQNSSPTLIDVVFAANSAADEGGALYNDGSEFGKSTPVLINAVFANNASEGNGGAVYNEMANPVIINTTFTGNTAGGDGAVMYSTQGTRFGLPRLVNGIVFGNGGPENANLVVSAGDIPVNADHAVLEEGCQTIYESYCESVLTSDPSLYNADQPAGDDGTWGTGDDGLQLMPGSSMLEAGTNAPFESGGDAESVTTDLRDDTRIQNGTAVLAFNGASEDNKNILFYENGRFKYYDADVEFQPAAQSSPTGQWHHVAFAIAPDGSGALYVNGTEQATFTTDERPVAGGRFSIGQEWDNDTTGDFFAGRIDEVRLWTEARTQDEIRATMYRTMEDPAGTSGLAGYWRFDEDVSGTAYDLAGAARGTLNGDVQRIIGGVKLGQQSGFLTSGSLGIGLDGAEVQVQNVSTSGPRALQVYQFGQRDGPARTGSDAGENFSQVPAVLRRLNVTWGLSAPSSSAADVTFHYSDARGGESGARTVVLKREGPGDPWMDVTDQFTRDPEAQTFSATGVSTFSEYAIGLSRALQVDGTPGTGDPSDRGWRFLGVPTASPLVAEDLRLNGTVPSFTLPSGHMLHRWDDAQGSGSPTGGYVPIENGTETLQPGRGVALYLFDEDPFALDPSMTIDVAGDPALRGDEPVTVDGLTQTARWHLLANPYPSGYDLSGLTDLTANGFQAAVQRYDATAGTWVVEDQSTAELSIWQAFFVERTDFSGNAGATSLTFDPAGRLTGAPFVGSKTKATTPPTRRARLALGLTVTSAEGDTLSRDAAAQVLFDARATGAWDPWDASKLTPLASQYALLAPAGTGRADSLVAKAVESRPWPSDGEAQRQEIPLRLTTRGLEGEREATLSVRRWTLPEGWRARIVDTASEMPHPLRPGTEHAFTLRPDADRTTPRFILQVAPKGTRLPVELAAFEVAQSEAGVRLRWRTASETSNSGFVVQRRMGARERGSTGAWEKVGFVEGAGTTRKPQTYRLTDTDPPYAADTLAYRLKQIDADGTAHLSDVVTVGRSAVQEVQLRGSFPNPARTQATIRYALPRAAEVHLDVYDVLGRRVMTLVKGRQDGGRKQVQLDSRQLSGLASGTYFYRLIVGGQAKTRKLTVVH